MKRIILTLLAVSLLATMSAQTAKCGIDTKALVREEVAAGAKTISFLVKVVPDFDRAVFEKAGVVIGAQGGPIVTMRVPVESLGLLDSSKEVVQYSISHRVGGMDCDKARADTRADSVQNGLGTIDGIHIDGEGVLIGITDWGFDYSHPNYNGQTSSNWRMERAWDHFKKSGPAPAGYNYGTGTCRCTRRHVEPLRLRHPRHTCGGYCRWQRQKRQIPRHGPRCAPAVLLLRTCGG